MSRIDYIKDEIRKSNTNLQQRIEDVEHWLKDLRRLYKDLADEANREQEGSSK